MAERKKKKFSQSSAYKLENLPQDLHLYIIAFITQVPKHFPDIKESFIVAMLYPLSITCHQLQFIRINYTKKLNFTIKLKSCLLSCYSFIGNLHLLQWAFDHLRLTRLSKKNYKFAACGGKLNVIKYLKDMRCPYDINACSYAAREGHFEVLQWLKSNGCPWNEDTCKEAAYGGHLEILKWLRINKCPWDENTCAMAAVNGHLETLKWAREQCCPWDENTCGMAARGGHLQVLKWAREMNCPWDFDVWFYATVNNHQHVLKWAEENNCPKYIE